MERKFKVGDIVAMDIINPYSFTIKEIVVGTKEIIGQWGYNSTRIITNSYAVVDNQDGNWVPLPFCEESIFHIIGQIKTSISSLTTQTLCPKCNGELVDKYSDWAGKDIKKCKSCGWC